MKTRKLGRVDKWGLAVVLGLLVALLGWRFFPPQRCDVHGEWLKREKTLVTYAPMAMTFSFKKNQEKLKCKFFPHSGDLIRQTTGQQGLNEGQFERFEFVRCCRRCQEAAVKWRAMLY